MCNVVIVIPSTSFKKGSLAKDGIHGLEKAESNFCLEGVVQTGIYSKALNFNLILLKITLDL